MQELTDRPMGRRTAPPEAVRGVTEPSGRRWLWWRMVSSLRGLLESPVWGIWAFSPHREIWAFVGQVWGAF